MTGIIATSEIGLHLGDYGVMVLYMLGVLAIGLWFSRSATDTENYLLGGRSMAWWLVGVSYLVSLLSTISIVAIPGHAYKYGITLMLNSVLLPFMAIGTFYLFIRFYFQGRVFTPFKYLENRFDGRVRVIGSGLYLFTRVTYLALVLYSSAKVFEGASNWPLAGTILVVVSLVLPTLLWAVSVPLSGLTSSSFWS